MKNRIWLILLMAGMAKAGFSLNNRFYIQGLWGQGLGESGNYAGVSLGWQGVLPNTLEDLWESGFGAYNLGFLVEGGYYKRLEAESLGSVHVGVGISGGQYFMVYGKPSVWYAWEERVFGVSGTLGFKVHTFIHDIALSFGTGVEVPFYQSGSSFGVYPRQGVGVIFTFDVIYEMLRTKKKQERMAP